MGDAKKRRIGGIQNKVFILILTTVILLAGSFAMVSIHHSNMLSELAVESSVKQQAAIEDTTNMVMDAVVSRSLTQSNRLEARLADDMFRSLRTRVEMLAEYAEKLLSDPDTYPRYIAQGPDPARNGEVLAQLILADGVDAQEPELADRIGLIANMSDLMVSLFGVSAETNSCFIALPDGVFLIADNRSAMKFDAQGNAISYDPVSRPWYKLAVENGDLSFTDVETDAFTGDIGIVCSKPVYVDGKLAAVVGCDLFLTSMHEAVQASDDDGTYICVINQYGHVVFSPKTDGVFQVTPSSSAVDLRNSDNAALASVISDSMQANTEMRLIELEKGAYYYIVGSPMETIGWGLISVCSQEAAMQPSALLREKYEEIEQESRSAYGKGTDASRLTANVLFVIILAAMLAGALVLGRRIVMPLKTITQRISELREGNLEFKMEKAYRTGDEIEELAESFASLSHKTVEYVEKVKKVTAEKERIGAELSLATDIQAAMLPHIFPPFPERREFDIYGSMDPAREVGGDFFDYFLIDDDHLCMVIADVSGKGVPAALFMMASKIILQSCAMLGHSAASILAKTNEAICSNNEAQMFVTVWLGILEISTGEFTAANAGHEYPMIQRPNSPFEIVKDKHGFVIGGFDHMKYDEYHLHLEPGTKLFVYTDGVPEATNAEHELFGTERILDALNSTEQTEPRDILVKVKHAVDDFVKDAEQFDDLTMLCLEYRGVNPKGDDVS